MSAKVAILLTDTSVMAARLRSHRRRWTIIDQYRVAVTITRSLNADTDLAAAANAIMEAVRAVGGLGEGATLIIPGGWCYTHGIEVAGRRFTNRSASYAFEEFLPVALEDVTCAFARGDNGRALGVAVAVHPMKSLLDRLNADGVVVERITPEIFCAAAAAESSDGSSCGIMIRDENRRVLGIQPGAGLTLEVVRTISGTNEAHGGTSLTQQVALTETACGVNPELYHLFDLETERGCGSVLCAAGSGRSLPDLCTGALAPRDRMERTTGLVIQTAAVLAMFLLVLAGYLYLQRSQFTDRLAQVRAQQEAVYQQVFPGSVMPQSPAMRLASERIRLERATRQKRSTHPADIAPQDRLAPLTVLRHAAAFIPDDVRINLTELTIDEHQLSLRGQTRDHRDAERISEALHRIDGLAVRPPRTSRLDAGGVEFAIRGVRVEKPLAGAVADAR